MSGVGNADPHFLRATFDESPEAYDRSRPVPPQPLFDDLITLARLEPGARLVEVGCGTGQATLALAERGYEIVAIELGESLANFTRRKLMPFPRVTIVSSSFEEWSPAGELFDAMIAFNSFHWHRRLDDEVRRALFERIHRRISARAEQAIAPTMAAVLYVAERV